MKIQYIKTRDVKNPERKGRNAGIDLFVPNDLTEFDGMDTIKGHIRLKHSESCNIPSGIKFKIPKDHCMIAFNKSGIASKYSLLMGACVIDENYTGEVHINLINTGLKDVYIYSEQKIIQLILIKQNYLTLEEVKNETEIFDESDFKERGEKGFGSTDP